MTELMIPSIKGLTPEIQEAIEQIKTKILEHHLNTFHRYRECGQIVLDAGYRKGEWGSEVRKWACQQWETSQRTFRYMVQLGEMTKEEFGSVTAEFKSYYKWTHRSRLPGNTEIPDGELGLFMTLGYSPKPWDIWNYKKDEKYGLIDYPGGIPAGIVFNTLYFYTEPGNLVVDPMAGGGVVGDVCKVVGRRCLMFDINPARAVIEQHDLKNGFPETELPDLVFLDPPYYKKMEKDYGPNSVSALNREQYLNFFSKLAHDIWNSDAKRVAFLMSDYTDDEDITQHIFIWDYVQLFLDAGWFVERHIMAPIPTTALHPDFVIKFRKIKKLGRLGRSLVIFRRSK